MNDNDLCAYTAQICQVRRETHDKRSPFGLTHPFTEAPASLPSDGLFAIVKWLRASLEWGANRADYTRLAPGDLLDKFNERLAALEESKRIQSQKQ